jgi:hypothetical protein
VPSWLAYIIECADVRMVQIRYRACFALETARERRAPSRRQLTKLEGDGPAQKSVARAVDLTHAARAEQRIDAIGTYMSCRTERHADCPNSFIRARLYYAVARRYPQLSRQQLGGASTGYRPG